MKKAKPVIRMQESEMALKLLMQDIIHRIELDIAAAIRKGEKKIVMHFGNGKDHDPAWEMAIERLRRCNKDYKFEVNSKLPIWQLIVTWS